MMSPATQPSESPESLAATWQFWIDRGGTFTDCVAKSPDGKLHVAKLLSSDSAPIEIIRKILELEPSAPIPPCSVRLGSTIATNALLERKGAPTALVITRGFGDLLEIARRRDLYEHLEGVVSPIVGLCF